MVELKNHNTKTIKRKYNDHNNNKSEIGILLLNNQRQHATLRIQKDMLPYVLC
jgi:hypothetical protein